MLRPSSPSMFIGVEQEDFFRYKTLFLVGEPTVNEVMEALTDFDRPVLYFGAGFLSKVSFDYIQLIIRQVLQLEKPLRITLETQDVDLATKVFLDYRDDITATYQLLIVIPFFMENVPIDPQELVKVPKLLDLGAGGAVKFKLDFQEHVFTVPVQQMNHSRYEDYEDDHSI